VNAPELIWEGERDSGDRAAQLSSIFASGEVPSGVSILLDNSRVDIDIRSAWAFVTWAVSALMLWFASENWLLLVLVPFMVGAAIMQSFGRVSIIIRDSNVNIFEGVLGVGRRLKVPLSAIRRIEYCVKRGRGGSTAWILLNDGKFGRHLNQEQSRFVIAFLLEVLK